jgi:hypothetical protein
LYGTQLFRPFRTPFTENNNFCPFIQLFIAVGKGVNIIPHFAKAIPEAIDRYLIGPSKKPPECRMKYVSSHNEMQWDFQPASQYTRLQE